MLLGASEMIRLGADRSVSVKPVSSVMARGKPSELPGVCGGFGLAAREPASPIRNIRISATGTDSRKLSLRTVIARGPGRSVLVVGAYFSGEMEAFDDVLFASGSALALLHPAVRQLLPDEACAMSLEEDL